MLLNTVPHLDQFFGVWAIQPDALAGFRAWAEKIDLHVHLASDTAQAAQRTGTGEPLTIRGGVAIIGIYGLMLKHQSSVPGSTSTALARRKVREAIDNDAVSSILLHVESGGGTFRGTTELADDVRDAAARKPTWAFIDDVGASAAYFVASQANKVYANAPAMVGSIGTYAVIEDTSGRAERDGVKVHVLRSGAFKGMGHPGTKVTDAHLAELQRLVDGHQKFFTQAVASGRKMTMERAASLADGRIHHAPDAVKLGLIDGIASLEATYESLALGHDQVRALRGPTSTSKQNTAGVVSRSQPPASCGPNTKGKTMDTYPGDAVADAEQYIREQVASGKTKQQAILTMIRERPELHQAWIAQYNERVQEERLRRYGR